MGGVRDRSGWSEEKWQQERRKAKERVLLKRQGRGGMVDAAPMQARIRKLHDVHEISFQRISDKTGVDLASVKWHYYGRSSARPDTPLITCQWKTHNAIMSTPFGPADVRRDIRSTGTQRRVRALIAAGFPQTWIAETTGRNPAHLGHFLLSDATMVGSEYAAVVEQVFRKYIDTDPLTVGVSKHGKGYALAVARKRDYAPAECWDEDTIDDPQAVPEYTGACGTEEGYRIHIRETIFEGNPIPLCRACREAVETVVYREEVVFRHKRFSELMDERGLNPRRLAAQMYRLDPQRDAVQLRRKADVLYRWRDGTRQPRTRGLVQTLCMALEVPLSELLDVEATERASTQQMVGNGQFNRHVLRAALDMAGISYSDAAKLPGAEYSSAAVSKWLSGQMRPRTPKKLQPIADHFGVPVEVFFQ